MVAQARLRHQFPRANGSSGAPDQSAIYCILLHMKSADHVARFRPSHDPLMPAASRSAIGSRIKRVVARGVVGLILVGLLLWGAAVSTLDSFAISRALVWGDADVDDWMRFAAHSVPARGDAPPLEQSPVDERLDLEVIRPPGHDQVQDTDQFMVESETTALIVLRGDQVVLERYYNGSSRQAVQTSFSVAKAFVSTLIGIAIADGHITSVDDPVTRYIPELAERDRRFDAITLRHLLTMSSGLRYEKSGTPWGDDALTYYSPDLRQLALNNSQIETAPGQRFLYNNYNPLLLGIVLERATGESVARYLERSLWVPLGMEASGSWSVDSEASGFEKMESGINARAIDFARLGLLHLHGGAWQGEQIVPSAWVTEAVTPWVTEAYAGRGFGYYWWTMPAVDDRGERYLAIGNKGQYIFVAPGSETVVVRFGRDFGYDHWPELLDEIAAIAAAD